MGGYGSGRRFSSKSTTSAYHQIDVRRWQREGLLEPRRFFNSKWLHDGEVIYSITARAEVGRVILTYGHRSNEQVHSRALGRAQAIRMKLGGSPSLIEDFPLKPKGMQWRTYERLKRQAADAEDLYWPRVYKLIGLRDRC